MFKVLEIQVENGLGQTVQARIKARAKSGDLIIGNTEFCTPSKIGAEIARVVAEMEKTDNHVFGARNDAFSPVS